MGQTGLLQVAQMLYGGNGIVRDASGTATTALPFVLPGELIQRLEGQHFSIVERSPERVAPLCIHFGKCGGCHYQHASYAAQVAIKSGILRDAVSDAGVTGLPEIVVHTAEPFGYRNRIRLRVSEIAGEQGPELRVGYNRHEAAAGDAMLAVAMCPIASPMLWQAAETFTALANTAPIVARWLKSAIEVELFASGGDGVKLQLVVFVRKAPAKDFAQFCEAIRHVLPELAGAGVAILPSRPSQRGRRSERFKPGPQWGAAGMIYPVEADLHWITRGSFFQVNRFLVQVLVQLATASRQGALAWDLYAGVGLFSRALARSFAQVLAVEVAEPAASDLARSLGGTPHRALPMTTLDFLQAAVVQRERPDLIVMDPPRAGLGPQVCALLARIRAPELVYVSCDPVTLARDIRQLTTPQAKGAKYKVAALHLVDMFPQTFHLESVAVLRLE